MVLLSEVLWREAELPPLCRVGRTCRPADVSDTMEKEQHELQVQSDPLGTLWHHDVLHGAYGTPCRPGFTSHHIPGVSLCPLVAPMAACCTEGCWEGVRLLVWVYLQLLVQQREVEEEEEEVVVLLRELHSPVKTGGHYIS